MGKKHLAVMAMGMCLLGACQSMRKATTKDKASDRKVEISIFSTQRNDMAMRRMVDPETGRETLLPAETQTSDTITAVLKCNQQIEGWKVTRINREEVEMTTVSEMMQFSDLASTQRGRTFTFRRNSVNRLAMMGWTDVSVTYTIIVK